MPGTENGPSRRMRSAISWSSTSVRYPPNAVSAADLTEQWIVDARSPGREHGTDVLGRALRHALGFGDALPARAGRR